MYLGISLTLLFGSGWLAAKLLGLTSLWEKVMAATCFGLAATILISLTVGALPGGYRPLPLTAAAAILFISLLLAAILRRSLTPQVMTSEERTSLGAYVAAVAVAAPVWLWQWLSGLLLPPIYWDELYYHLTQAAIWAHAGQVTFRVCGNPFVIAYPAGFETVAGWSMAVTGTDIWADLLGFPFMFIGLAVIMAMAERLGVRPWNAFWAGLLWLFTPDVIFHAKSSYVDLPMSVVFGIAMYFLFRFAEGRGGRFLFIAGTAMGLLVGAKYSGPYMALAGLLPIGWRLWVRRPALRLTNPAWWRVGLLYFGPMVLVGGFWYVRNIILFHNPVEPMRIPFLGSSLFSGYFRPDAFTYTPESGWVTFLRALVEYDPDAWMDGYWIGLGPQLLSLGILPVLLFLGRRSADRVPFVWLWLLPMSITIAVLPAKYPRYMLDLSLFLLPFCGWLLETLGHWFTVVTVKVAAVVCIAYAVLVATPHYTLSPPDYDRSAQTPWSALTMSYGRSYSLSLGQWNGLKEGPLRIYLHPGVRLTYPALGPQWQNETYCFLPTTEAAWVEQVLAAGTDLVVIDTVDGPGVTKVERGWLEANPALFRRVHSDPITWVYLVLPGDPAHQSFVGRVTARLAQAGGVSP